MQFKSLLLVSLATFAFADGTSTSTDSTAISSRTDSSMSHSSSDRTMSTHVESGYALTTDASGSTIAMYTGIDTKKPRTTSVTTALAAATSADHSSSSSHTTTSGSSSSTTGSSSGSATGSHNQAKATAIPLIGAAAMAGIAFAI